MSKTMYLLYEEVFAHPSRDELVGVFTSREAAAEAQAKITDNRSGIEEFPVNQLRRKS